MMSEQRKKETSNEALNFWVAFWLSISAMLLLCWYDLRIGMAFGLMRAAELIKEE